LIQLPPMVTALPVKGLFDAGRCTVVFCCTGWYWPR